MKKLKMITESNYDLQICESENKKLYVEGVFAAAEIKNGNGRIYRKETLKNQIDKLMEEKVKTKQALCEINHPTDRSEIDLTKAAGLVEKLEWNNDNKVYGRARVLENTPYGGILKGLVQEGVSVGISSRGLGTTSFNEKYGAEVVNEDYNLITFDFVSNPSAGNAGAFVNGILEGKEFPVYNDNEKEEEKPKSPTDEQIRHALKEHEKNILNFFNSLLNEKDEILNDPLYKKVIDAKTDAERAKALETLRSIRGESAVVTLINYLKNKK